ncbi:MAG: LysR family transcriptional regulator [Firmicutes bacterium]|nr:LysR family transcriptional regulator [Bacillota bacterium]
MNEQIWRTFKAVSEHQSITQAARFLNLSQSAVSQHIHQLEAEYGTALFIRTAHGVRLTATGEIVYRYITHLLSILEESRQQVQEQLDMSPPKLVIGASLTIAEYILPHALPRIELPGGRQHVTVYMANSHDVLDRIINEDIDVGLIEAPIHDAKIVMRPFLEDRLKVVVSRDHPWARLSSVALEDFLAAPLIVREPGSGTRMVLEEALRQIGVPFSQLDIRFVLGTTQAIKAMIAQNMGISVLSPYTILPHEQHLFHLLPIRELALPRSLSLIHRHDLAHPAAKRLIRALFHLNWQELLTDPIVP